MPPLGRIAFLGTGSFGVPLLSRLPALCDDLVVVSQPDRPAGRGLQTRSSPVAGWAREHGVTVETPRRLRSDEGRALLQSFAPDGLLLAAYGQLVPPDLLEAAPRPPLNVHPSLLPRHRGAAPVASTILAGDPQGGVSLMVMTAELDAGPLVAQWPATLTGRETTPELEGRLAELAAEVVPPELEAWAAGGIEATPQDERQATMIRPFRRADGWIDWRQSAASVDRRVRALQPWPGAWTTLDGKAVKLLDVELLDASARGAAGTGEKVAGRGLAVTCGGATALLVKRLQPEGKGAQDALAFLNGLRRDSVAFGT